MDILRGYEISANNDFAAVMRGQTTGLPCDSALNSEIRALMLDAECEDRTQAVGYEPACARRYSENPDIADKKVKMPPYRRLTPIPKNFPKSTNP